LAAIGFAKVDFGIERLDKREDRKMRLNGMGRVIGGAVLALAVTLGVTASANAQYRDYDYRNNGYQGQWSRDRVRDYALKIGYHQGYGETRQLNYQVRSYRDMPGFRDTNSFQTWMGHEDTYRENYRRGYEMGHNDAKSGRDRRYGREDVEAVLGNSLENVYGNGSDYRYDDPYYRDRDNRDNRYDRRDARYGRYDRNEVTRIAQQNGYRDGLQHGQQDRARNRAYNYQNDNRYRNARAGYRSEYGNQNLYEQAFREGYRRGYDDGYRNRNTGSRFPWPF
jgi:hypothetical protein